MVQSASKPQVYKQAQFMFQSIPGKLPVLEISMERGDHIYVDLGSFKQHGVYCGNNVVIYWTNENSSKGEIRKSLLEEFARGRRVKIRHYRHKCSSVDSVIQRAEGRLNERSPKHQFPDSKAFTMYCKTGLKIGDHIYIDHGGYIHHGIYYANDKVAHYTGKNINITSLKGFSRSKTIRVGSCRIKGFSKSKTIRVRRYSKCSSVEKVVERVERRLGEKKYNLIFKNCEHFATWCKTRKWRSKQVEKFPETAIKFLKYSGERGIKEADKARRRILKGGNKTSKRIKRKLVGA